MVNCHLGVVTRDDDNIISTSVGVVGGVVYSLLMYHRLFNAISFNLGYISVVGEGDRWYRFEL